MNKTINGKRYDTEKAKPVGEAGNGLYPGDLDYYCETLYLKRTGEFFLHLEGGPRSGCAKADGTGWVGGEELRPVSFDGARAWAEKNLTADEYAELFGEPDEDGTSVVATFSLSAAAKAKLEREASRTGKAQSAILEELIGKL